MGIFKVKTRTYLVVTEKKIDDFPFISSPRDAAVFFHGMLRGLDQDKEHFAFCVLSTAQRVLGAKVAFSGTYDSTQFEFAEFWRGVVYFGGNTLIICHNHPSGRLDPSREDLHITKLLKSQADLLHYRLLDHLIISANGDFYSLSENGHI